jgi:hypothetical protein
VEMLPDKLKMRPIRRYRGGRVVGFHSRAIWGLRGMTGNALRQRVFGGAVLVCVALAYALILWTNLAGTGADHVVDVQPPPPVASTTAARRPTASTAYAKLSAALNIMQGGGLFQTATLPHSILAGLECLQRPQILSRTPSRQHLR